MVIVLPLVVVVLLHRETTTTTSALVGYFFVPILGAFPRADVVLPSPVVVSFW
jgi:hypothetical protein